MKKILILILLFCLFLKPSFAISKDALLHMFNDMENYTTIVIELAPHQPVNWNKIYNNVASLSDTLEIKPSQNSFNGYSVEQIAENFGGYVYAKNSEYSYAKIIVNKENHTIITDSFKSLGFEVRDNIMPSLKLDKSKKVIGLPYLYYGSELKGDNIIIGIIDTGLDGTHQDFKDENGISPSNNKVIYWNDTTTANLPCCVDGDADTGHGTHVASIAAGTGANSSGKYKGVAPNAKLMIWKTSSGYLHDEDWVATAFEDVLRQNPRPDVVSMSLGFDWTNLPPEYGITVKDLCNNNFGTSIYANDLRRIRDAILNIINNGIPIVIAAGDGGPFQGTIDWPACMPGVISVGATYKEDYSIGDSHTFEPLSNVSRDWSTNPINITVNIPADGKTFNYYWELTDHQELLPVNLANGLSKVIQPNSWPATIEVKIEGQRRNRCCYVAEDDKWDPGNKSQGDEYWAFTKTFDYDPQHPYIFLEVYAAPHFIGGRCTADPVAWWHSRYNTFQCTGTPLSCNSYNPYNQNGCTNQAGCEWCGCWVGGILGHCFHTNDSVADYIACTSPPHPLGTWIGCRGTSKSCSDRNDTSIDEEIECGTPQTTGCIGSWLLDNSIDSSLSVKFFRTDSLTLEGLPLYESSRGPLPQNPSAFGPLVSAPGYNICAARAAGTIEVPNSICGNDNYRASSGSSMAAPHVAGLIALSIEAFNKTTGRYPTESEIITSLYFSDRKVYSYNDEGLGLINAQRSIDFITKTPPQYSHVQEPTDPSLYNPSATYTFSIDWTDNAGVSKVTLEMDGTNYTPTSIGDTYSMTFATCGSSDPGSPTGGGGGGSHFYMCSMEPIIPLMILFSVASFIVRKNKKNRYIPILLFTLVFGLLFVEPTKSESPCLSVGAHHYKWYAKDIFGAESSTEIYDFTIYETDPVSIYIDSPENKTYSSNSIDLKYSVSSPFEISWIGYSLDNKLNITLKGNTSLNLAEGSHNILFYANTTYGVMNSSDRIYFTIKIPKPDLIIENIWSSSNTINYKIKNQGNANAGSSYSNLYVDNVYKTNDYVSSLSAGSSLNKSFSYSWVCSGTSDTIKVCADANYNIAESDESNNCLTKTFNCPATSCTCTTWQPTFTCCSGKEKWTRTCNPRGCQAESKCEGPCFI
jgi:subtilisin family serine protease